MIKIKLGLLVLAHTEGYLNELLNLKLKAKDAFLLSKAVKKIGEEVETYLKIRDQKVKELGTVEDGKEVLKSDSENFPKFIKEMAEIDQTEIELDFEPFSMDVLGDNYISPKTLLALEFMFA